MSQNAPRSVDPKEYRLEDIDYSTIINGGEMADDEVPNNEADAKAKGFSEVLGG